MRAASAGAVRAFMSCLLVRAAKRAWLLRLRRPFLVGPCAYLAGIA